MIGFAGVPSAAAETDGRGRSSVNTVDATHGDVPQVAAEEEAAGADEEAAAEAIGFRLSWTSSHPLAAALEETTPMGPKRFTYGPVPFRAIGFDTVQVFSISIKEIKPELGFHWPLQVYGLVAARDNSDLRLRNIIFSRDRNHCQTLTAEDSSLVLTGPSRAVVAHGPITFEIELKVKGSKESEDKLLSFLVTDYNSNIGWTTYGKLLREIVSDKASTTEVLFAQLEDTVEATIDIKVVEGSWNNFCPRLIARTKSFPDVDFVLFDLRGGDMVESDGGVIQLSRSVVTVESNGELELIAEAQEYGSSTIVVRKTIMFAPKRIGATDESLDLGFCKMDVCVSWSLIIPVN